MTTAPIHRIEVRPSARAGDPLGDSVKRSARALGFECRSVRTARVYLLEAALDPAALEKVRTQLLTDPVLEESALGSRPPASGDRIIEVHPLPGVMDPAAQTVRDSVRMITGSPAQVITGVRYDLAGLSAEQAADLARRLLANGVIEQVHTEPWLPRAFPRAATADQSLRRVSLTALTDEQLAALSRSGHLFLSLAEMRAIQSHYRSLGREPTDIELETLAQTWSEHCVHKTLKSTVNYREEGEGHHESGIRWEGRPGVSVNADGSVTIRNLLKSTVAAATHELMADGVDWPLSVFVDNAGVIAFDREWAINVKVETHNRPSAIEPYGGAATGVGGCIRDVIGTGLGAKPIANTDVFCVAFPDSFTTVSDLGSFTPAVPSVVKPLPPGVLHPRRVLSRVVDGVRDYGNRMGIPTVNGAVYFDDRYVGNPLVFCGCVGLMHRDLIQGEVRPGDCIIALGGRTGRDGIHGATFSSAELTHTHADEFAHAVQIGNAIEEKRLLDAILRARDFPSSPAPSGGGARVLEGGGGRPLFSALTDCGAGGFSSAIGEMASKIGAEVHLDRAPLKYEGLRYDEIWISESQERMILAVPEANVPALRAICDEEGVELADLGVFGTPSREIILNFQGREVGRLDCAFLHDGIPMPTREAVWSAPSPAALSGRGQSEGSVSTSSTSTTASPPASSSGSSSTPSSSTGVTPVSSSSSSSSSSPFPDIKQALLRLLAHPNIASKRWIVRQYDHEVQGNTIIKPLVGPRGIGPGDAAVLQPVAGSKQGIAIACGLATPVGDPALNGDPYLMAIAAVDECVRNLVCVGADPDRIAILDNFCWPSCDNPRNMASLVRAAVGCYDAAKAYRTPFVSGKDSLNNQFRYTDPHTGREVLIEIPPTLLITGVGIVPDVTKCVTMDLKKVGSLVYLVGDASRDRNHVGTARSVADLIRRGMILSAHDCSEGGWLVAIAELLIASESRERNSSAAPGIRLLDAVLGDDLAFAESPGRYVVEVDPKHRKVIEELGPHARLLGTTDSSGNITAPCWSVTIPVTDLRRAFLGTLDW